MAKRRPLNINSAAFEKAHLERIEKYASKMDIVYNWAADEYGRIAASIPNFNPDKLFSFKDYPQTNDRVNKLLKESYSKMDLILRSGIESEWMEAAIKNDKYVQQVFKSSSLTKKQLEKYNDRNLEALRAFQDRKEAGMSLSNRVWNYTRSFQKEMELGIDAGLGEGASADRLSRVLRQNLKEPEKLFRRVRDKRGNLVLSKAAQQYNPGQGVYRSSYKNAMRLTRTETNMAYRASDHTRWQQLDFVVGIEIRLSNNPNHCPTCEAMAGKYPKDFKFIGWHPQCRCNAISILKTDEEIDADDIRILQGLEPLEDSVNAVTDVPDGFKKWISENKDRTKRASSTPYWIRDNFKDGNIEKGLKFGTKEIKPIQVQKGNNIDLNKFIKGNLPTDKEVNDILLEYARINPKDFRNGLESVSFRKANSYMMMHSQNYQALTNEWVGKAKLSISTQTFVNNTFNPAVELKSALAAIRNNQQLTFDQEYSIESLWHEILHAKTKTPPRNLTSGKTKAMETLNQFTARHTYDDFLEKLGGKASHKNAILENGYGYRSWITEFRKKLELSRITEEQALKDLLPVLMGDYSKIEFELLKYFAKANKT